MISTIAKHRNVSTGIIVQDPSTFSFSIKGTIVRAVIRRSRPREPGPSVVDPRGYYRSPRGNVSRRRSSWRCPVKVHAGIPPNPLRENLRPCNPCGPVYRHARGSNARTRAYTRGRTVMPSGEECVRETSVYTFFEFGRGSTSSATRTVSTMLVPYTIIGHPSLDESRIGKERGENSAAETEIFRTNESKNKNERKKGNIKRHPSNNIGTNLLTAHSRRSRHLR